ncbi:MAG: hypothetical protein HY343_00820 [Lentisphaerae bacterium]|nr:hypothetical protein [Lentisphaerota bacterium]
MIEVLDQECAEGDAREQKADRHCIEQKKTLLLSSMTDENFDGVGRFEEKQIEARRGQPGNDGTDNENLQDVSDLLSLRFHCHADNAVEPRLMILP